MIITYWGHSVLVREQQHDIPMHQSMERHSFSYHHNLANKHKLNNKLPTFEPPNIWNRLRTFKERCTWLMSSYIFHQMSIHKYSIAFYVFICTWSSWGSKFSAWARLSKYDLHSVPFHSSVEKWVSNNRLRTPSPRLCYLFVESLGQWKRFWDQRSVHIQVRFVQPCHLDGGLLETWELYGCIQHIQVHIILKIAVYHAP